MRKTLIISLLLLMSTAASAQKQATWREVAPPNEEFAVLMPAQEWAMRRVLPVTDELKIVCPVYEVSAEDLRFMVVSFNKWEREGQPVLLKTFDGVSKGFEHAVRQSRGRDGSTAEVEEDFTLKGMKIRPYHVRIDGKKGVARLYEAPRHFYAVIVLGATYGDARVDRFLKSFKVKTGAPEPLKRDNADDMSALMGMVPPPPPAPTSLTPAPEGPWPIDRPTGAPRAPISGGVLNGKAISKPAPEYPAIAKAARASGTVVVQVTFDEEGEVVSARAVSGHPLLQQAAVKAAYKARFSTVSISGQPVKVTGTLIYNFVLPPDPDDPPTRKY
ncbi:MAG TPA: energy transducer TonB [Pyrinomonadaceae bacterium]|nr:energy transducer TonB [Pyrinomonadaceae bacterium]